MVIGHDMRPSSPSLSRAFAEGVARTGTDVTIVGLCSTDGLYYASGALDAPGAMFTASHNPAQYNGIKMCHAGARPVGQTSGLPEVRTLAEGFLDDGLPEPAATPGTIDERDLLTGYAEHLRSLVDLSGVRPLKVVVDAGNGMGGFTVPSVLGTASGLAEPAARDRPAVLRGSTAPSPTTRPTRSTRRTSSTCRPRCASTAPTSAWPSTATPTAASSSTSAASR
ncbi:hypothetical protein GCM10025868_36810 [Angustibacter aerolatus]|uniref:Alpha-D-phosphohexomutase alpha/beta/alpha domain-containing protein n=1 Tax=Angustibacter aerolatus TaxID=1162965 RepID=A0ABQ6JP37_9ACTN|nr:hypothetical protein GCM10025868_36810 [Angustibacter aerolatus]